LFSLRFVLNVTGASNLTTGRALGLSGTPT